MSCKYYINNGCSCGGCARLIKSISIAADSDLLRITIPEQQFKNHERICLCLAQSIPPEVSSDATVVVEIGTTGLAKMPLITRRGNLVYGDSIQNRKIYPLIAATDTSVFVLEDIFKLKSTIHTFPLVPEIFPPKES